MRTNNQLYTHISPAASFYYDGLSFKERTAYTNLMNAVKNKDNEVLLGNLNEEEISNVVMSLHYDHPELYYIDFSKYKYSKTGMGTKLMLKYRHHEQSNEVMKIVGQYLNIINQEKRTYERLFKIVDVFLDMTYLNSGREEEHCIFDPVMRKSGVCEGFSLLFALLCHEARIQCTCVSGTLDGGPHLWNIVELEGKLYNVDITTMLSTYKGSNRLVNYGAVLVPNYMLEKNIPELRFACNFFDRNPYFSSSSFFKDEKSFTEVIEEKVKLGKDFTLLDISEKNPLSFQRINELIQNKGIRTIHQIDRYLHCKISKSSVKNIFDLFK